MPALFAYLIAVALLLGGGYGALSWLAAPEPIMTVAKSTSKPLPAHDPDHSEPAAAQARQANSADAGKPEITSKTVSEDSGPVVAAAVDKAIPSDQPASPLPQPKPPAAVSQHEAKAWEPAQPNGSAHAEMPQAVTDQEAKQQAEAPSAEAPARHQEQSPQASSPGNAPTIASIAPAAKSAKRPHVRQASRRSERQPLEVMTLRTIELPDGRRLTQLIPHRSGDRYRSGGPATVFEPDE